MTKCDKCDNDSVVSNFHGNRCEKHRVVGYFGGWTDKEKREGILTFKSYPDIEQQRKILSEANKQEKQRKEIDKS